MCLFLYVLNKYGTVCTYTCVTCIQVERVRGGGVPVQASPGGAGEDKPADPGINANPLKLIKQLDGLINETNRSRYYCQPTEAY